MTRARVKTHMKIQVLGCSGGIGESLKTTSFLIDNAILIDAGTGIGELPLDVLRGIRTIFITHSHLDHICGVPLLVDTIFDSLTSPLTVYGLPETITALENHIFNNVIWPDFTRIPSTAKPVLKLNKIKINQKVKVGGIEFEPIPVNHIIPACGYRLCGEQGVVAFSGDTTTTDLLWDTLNNGPKVDLMVVEAAFPNSDIKLCKLAYHYCPKLLAEDLKKFKYFPDIYLTHLKPGAEATIMDECVKAISDRKLIQLVGSEIFHI